MAHRPRSLDESFLDFPIARIRSCPTAQRSAIKKIFPSVGSALGRFRRFGFFGGGATDHANEAEKPDKFHARMI